MAAETPPMNPIATAPRDGTIVRIIHIAYGSQAETRARVCGWWVTDEFIPVDVLDGDTSGANHGAILDEDIIGWRPDTP